MIRPPEYQSEAYTCPNCGAFARQRWRNIWHEHAVHGTIHWAEVMRVDCDACSDYQIWLDQRLLVPDRPPVPLPNPDLDEEIRQDYLEAASILGRSPRGSAALLRLALQKLCVQLGEKGDNNNDDIASLVAKGLPRQIQHALDVLRVVGNNAVHPGQIDLRDDQALATKLFGLINLIADNRISEPRRIAEMYDSLPATALEGIEKRDATKRQDA